VTIRCQIFLAQRAGPCWVRAASGTAGPRRARAVMLGITRIAGHTTSPLRPPDGEAARGSVRIQPIAAAGRRPLPTRRASPESASPCGRVGADAARPHERRPRQSCHYRAIHGSLDRSPADTHGQSHGCRDLLSSSSDQVAILPDLALQAGVTEQPERLSYAAASIARRPN
jgi:hypothetical protein